MIRNDDLIIDVQLTACTFRGLSVLHFNFDLDVFPGMTPLLFLFRIGIKVAPDCWIEVGVNPEAFCVTQCSTHCVTEWKIV